MEKKMVRVPFDVELAKKITNGEVEGRIVTRDGMGARIICWDRKGYEYPIIALIDTGKEEESDRYTICGRWSCDYDEENNFDLMLEIPEYMTFKDGDVATLGWHGEDEEYCEWITILKSVEADGINILTKDYVTFCLKCDKENYFPIDFDCTSDGARWTRKPTEPEKQKLIDALKESEEPKAKEYLKRFFNIEVKPECEFKPKDWILIRDNYEDMWCLDIYSHKVWDKDEKCYHYYCVGGWSYQCIPYNDKTAHLLGTTDNWEE